MHAYLPEGSGASESIGLRDVVLPNCRSLDHWINGLPRAEGIEIARFLTEHRRSPEFFYRFRWEPHSIAFWDNRCAHHYAINDYFPQVQSGYRIQIEGHAPPAAA